jgi:hypothetical protein
MIAPDRRAAEWALRLGGAAHIDGRVVKDIANLPTVLRISSLLGAPFGAVVRRNL